MFIDDPTLFKNYSWRNITYTLHTSGIITCCDETYMPNFGSVLFLIVILYCWKCYLIEKKNSCEKVRNFDVARDGLCGRGLHIWSFEMYRLRGYVVAEKKITLLLLLFLFKLYRSVRFVRARFICFSQKVILPFYF